MTHLSPEQVNALDHAGNAALHLAVYLGETAIVRLLLEHGARGAMRNGRRWSPLAISRALGSIELVRIATKAGSAEVASDYRRRVRAHLLPMLETLPDFSLVIDWKFKSWIPMTGRFCPSDRCLLQKHGSSVRLDFTIVGFENLAWKYGSLSAIIHGLQSPTPGRLSIVDWNAKFVRRPIDSLLQPDFPELASKDAAALLKQPIVVIDSDIAGVRFAPRRGWFSSVTTKETIGAHETELYDMTDLKMVSRKRPMPPFEFAGDGSHNDTNKHERKGALDPETYFTEAPTDATSELLFPGESVSSSSRTFGGTLYMADDFPLTIEQLKPVMELLAPTNDHWAKLESFLGHKLPPGFPVRLEMPVVPTVSASVEFTYGPLQGEPVFEIPSDFRIVRYKESFETQLIEADNNAK